MAICLIVVNQFINHCPFLKHVIESDLPELTSLFQRRCLMYEYKIESIFAWHMDTAAFSNDQQGKMTYMYENTMGKLYKTCMAV